MATTTTNTTGIVTTTDFAPPLQNVVQATASTQSIAAVTDIQKDGVTVDVTPRSKINFITGTGMTLTVADNSVNDRVDVTISAPGVQLDYAQFTSNVIVAGATEATATTLVAGNSITYDGTRVMILFYWPGTASGGAGSSGTGVILRDTTVLGQFILGTDKALSGSAFIFDTPAAGAHTYTVKAFQGGGYTVVAGAGGAGTTAPGFIQVTKA